ncbi:MAG: biopolymer transporter ExbD [Paludibacteraceae bacterium]|nr:biopolymer transporter ExbD [Paludibacteraceae bacterium]
MALKKRNKTSAEFSMSSMTDIIFLLLLFFMVASTMSSPNDMRVNLPQSSAKTATKAHIVKVALTSEGECSVADNGEAAMPIQFDDLPSYLQGIQAADSAAYVALYADEEVPYREIVRVLDIANENRLKLVIATKVKE